ncbi:aldolase [Leptospira idonii]|uniref:Aldolase n=1 Tax=Leptospira idonii TaxID=1193500 RepID=A0A4R9M1M4_9LEPT|nr:aldolase [Leptospira idonii]TGN20674.1 aldolase [Leptospira idonii]
MEKNLITLRKTLQEMKDHYAFVCLKTGTETEDMGESEIALLQNICQGILPLSVKIGGPEARNDIRICNRIGVSGISAPMVESEYALKNFIATLKNLLSASEYDKLKKAINLETITGYRNLLDIFDSAAFGDLQQVTAARSDLSASMDKKPDDPEVTRVSKKIIQEAKSRNKITSVGGTITKNNLGSIATDIAPDFINSRHVMVDTKQTMEIGAADVAECMLVFEMDLYELFSKAFPEKGFYYRNRVEINRERIGERKVLYFIR